MQKVHKAWGKDICMFRLEWAGSL